MTAAGTAGAHAAPEVVEVLAEPTLVIPVVRVDPADACGPWQLPAVLEPPAIFDRYVAEHGYPKEPVLDEEERPAPRQRRRRVPSVPNGAES